MRTCKRCGNAVPDDAVTCPHCHSGTAGIKVCTKCKAILSKDAKFCPDCGTPISNDHSHSYSFCQNCGCELVNEWERKNGYCAGCDHDLHYHSGKSGVPSSVPNIKEDYDRSHCRRCGGVLKTDWEKAHRLCVYCNTGEARSQKSLGRQTVEFIAKVIGMIISVAMIITGAFMLVNSGLFDSISSDITDAGSKTVTVSPTTYKSRCQSVEYETLARNPESYKGQYFTFTGKVIQVVEGYASTIIRMNVTVNEYDFWEDTIYVTLPLEKGDDRVLNDDIITIWGECDGLYTYITVLGSSVSIPRIDAMYYELTKESD